MAVPYTFGSATSAIPLSQLDSNFATTITLGNTAIQLGNTVTTLNNMTLANVTVTTVSGASANAVVYTNSSGQVTANSSVIALDTSGNLGLGVTPNAWNGNRLALQIGGSSGGYVTANSGLAVASNYYYSSGDKFVANGYAPLYYINSSIGQHQWYTSNNNSSGAGTAVSLTQAMTLDASGALLTGGTSYYGDWGGGAGTIQATSTSYANISAGSSRSDQNSVRIGSFTFDWSTNTSGYRTRAIIEAQSNGSTANKRGADLLFYTASDNVASPTERARITSGGRFLIGTTTNTYPLYVNLASDTGDFFARFQNTNASSPYGLFMQYSAAAPNSSVNEFIYCSDSSALRMSVRSNGGIANYTANNSPLSDRRLKKDIKPAGSYLEKICAIPVVTYLYNDQTDDLPNLGVIAQDVQAAAPELCNEEGWGTKAEDGTNYLGIWETDIQYALMKCIQELKAELDTAKAEIAALKGAK